MAGDTPKQMQFNSLAELRSTTVNHHKKGDTKVAKQLYRAYLAKSPRDAAIWSNLGALFCSEKNHQMAVICQRRALSIEPDAQNVLNNASNAHFDAGEPEQALELRRRALAAEP